ncbi:hypothetical protein VC596_24625 [Citrobacter freundii]|uniref:hypothetical protein n=1 Tax=Enterobacteriaceae TaxID=543 RepID=UPI0015C4EBFC|nr:MULTISPECIES: hypothetical protein [Enterobacteriaceae]MDV1217321.1 hypothetical protein [Citrobacter freundii]MDV1777604.1 hypothetical protein [Citrobacter freundii]MEB0394192.1 hypothetical protein [Citrobacter freundii]MEB0455754.1 hypothetical protein [Citrobacter freundii]
MPKLDLILWIMKAEDRACVTDETLHQFLLKCGVSPGSIVFVTNQTDKTESSLEWSRDVRQPSTFPLLTLTRPKRQLS